MVDGSTEEDTRFYVEVNDPTKPVDLLYGPEIEDITHKMWMVDAALTRQEMGDIDTEEEVAMDEFHHNYTEVEEEDYIDDEIDGDYDDKDGWLNADGHAMLTHMESVVSASSRDPRIKKLEEYGPVHEHCRMYSHPETHRCLNGFVTVVYVRSIGYNNDGTFRYGTAYCRWGPIHIPGKILEWYGNYLMEGMKVPMAISYSPPEEGNHKPFRAKFGIDIWGPRGGGVHATQPPVVHMDYAEAVANHLEATERMNQ